MATLTIRFEVDGYECELNAGSDERGSGWVLDYVQPIIDKIKGMGGQPLTQRNNHHVPGPERDSRVCPIHNAKMTRKTKNGDSWYSHVLEDGTWCRGK